MTTRAAQLAADLRERVALGDVGADGALESEAGLGSRYGVSRVTVRRALEELRAEGLVESRRGSGWYVVGRSFHQALALGSFRHAGSAVAAAGGTPARRVVDFGFERAPGPVAAALDVEDGADVLRTRSLRTVDGVPLDVAVEWVPAALGAAISRADAESPGLWAALQRRGNAVGSVRQTVTAAVAAEPDAELLGVSPGTALLLVRRLALGTEGTPLALADHRYLGSRFSLEVEFRGWSAAGSAEPPGLQAAPPSRTTSTATEGPS